MSETYLYRHFDANGDLLYVGISLSAIDRLRQHRANSSWSNEIRTITVAPYLDRPSALRAEYEAIIIENPLHNRKRPVKGGDLIYEADGRLCIMPPGDGNWDALISAAAREFPDWIEDTESEFSSDFWKGVRVIGPAPLDVGVLA